MLNESFSAWPFFSNDEIDAVKSVLNSGKVNYWTGNECRYFEQEFAAFSTCEYAIAVSNGTVALELGLRSIGLQPGDEVIVTSRTFLASVSSIISAGGIPVFADVDSNNQNITSETISAVLTTRTKAVICVHLAGWPCDMDSIIALADKYNLFIIEDCAQAVGSLYKGQSVGSIGDVGCWSFCQDKIITTGGEGGMVTTNNKELWSKMWSYKDHGKSWEAVYEKSHPEGFRWLHESFGTNWRMTEMQAVIGRIQLNKLPMWKRIRQKYANQIWAASRKTGILIAPKLTCYDCPGGDCSNIMGCQHAAYKCYVFVDGNQKQRDRIMSRINEKGVPCFSGSCSEVYLEKAFKDAVFRPAERLSVAKRLGETSLMFLCHPTLTQAEIDKTCNVIHDVCCRSGS
jgi:dTDP-4-amino-4,6-dideoxygalactose transaminase